MEGIFSHIRAFVKSMVRHSSKCTPVNTAVLHMRLSPECAPTDAKPCAQCSLLHWCVSDCEYIILCLIVCNVSKHNVMCTCPQNGHQIWTKDTSVIQAHVILHIKYLWVNTSVCLFLLPFKRCVCVCGQHYCRQHSKKTKAHIVTMKNLTHRSTASIQKTDQNTPEVN